jgi:hypothetical protein
MKDKGVCDGCKYRVTIAANVFLKNTCDYSGVTGKSRLVKEIENGGYKTDSCICYDKGVKTRRIVAPR